MSILYVAIGGFLGSILRFFLSIKFDKHPIGTWITNITGSLLLAIFFRFYDAGMIGNELWLLIGVGFCGAYTTFSTFSNELLEYIIAKNVKRALLYMGASVFSTVVVVFIVLVV